MDFILLVFATKKEANATLSVLKATPVHEHLYRFDRGLILISGMGIANTIARTSQVLEQEKIDEIWNFGVAGTLKKEALGKFLPIQSVSKHLSMPPAIDEYSRRFGEELYPELFLSQEKGARLLTSDYPIHSPMESSFDLVDMEGYGVAFAAAHAKLPCRLWKIVSDFTQPGGPALIQKKLDQWSEIMAEEITSFFPKGS